jgi:hypothetical protein
MRSYSPSRAGPLLVRTPNARQVACRRLLGITGVAAALALASGLIGYFSQGGVDPVGRTGPFSYLSSN